MDSEDIIRREYLFCEILSIDAIERLQRIGYQPKDAENKIEEWDGVAIQNNSC